MRLEGSGAKNVLFRTIAPKPQSEQASKICAGTRDDGALEQQAGVAGLVPRCAAAPFAVSQAGCLGSHAGRSSRLRSSRTRIRVQ